MLDAEAGDLPKQFYIHSKQDAEDPEKVCLPTIDVSADPFDLDALETGELSGSHNDNGRNTNSQPPTMPTPLLLKPKWKTIRRAIQATDQSSVLDW